MMKRLLLALFALPLCAAPHVAQAQGANTDVYLARVTRIGDSIVVGTPANVTHRTGYDNQPSFTADSRAILYTAQSEGQTDIWRYDLASKRTTRLTKTPESEYSPTVTPDGRRFSVIRVERDSTQRLWSFTMAGRDPQLVLSDLKPVGYHAWLGSTRLAAYVLGTPSTLHLVNRNGTRDTVVARDVGRAIPPVPTGAKAAFSYTQRDAVGKLHIFLYGRGRTTHFAHRVVTVRPGVLGGRDTTTRVDSSATTVEPPYELAAAPDDNEFHVWTPDGVLLTASSSVLLRWNAQLPPNAAWVPVAPLAFYGVKNVSRLAFSPDGQWLAFVAEPVAP